MKLHKLWSMVLSCAMLASMTTLPAFAAEEMSDISDENTDVLYGDVNLDANINLPDAVLLNKAVSDAVQLSEPAIQNADCNADGSLTPDDSIALLRFLVHLTDSLPETGYVADKQQQALSFTSTVTMLGYDGEMYEFAISENGEAVITSSEELEAYIAVMNERRDVTKETLRKTYDDAFFEKNVLLLKMINQSCGGEAMYTVDNVYMQDDTIHVQYSDLYEDRPYIDIDTIVLAQVVLPKEQYHGEPVKWYYDDGSSAQMEWSVKGLSWYWDGFEATIGTEYIITSQRQLQEYFNSIMPEDLTFDVVPDEFVQESNEMLEQYDDIFFQKNVLLMKPTNRCSMRLENAVYDGDTMYINTYDEYYNQTEPLPDTGIFRYLQLLTVPQSQYHAENVVWNEAEITWSMESLGYQCSGAEETLEEEYIISSEKELGKYLDTVFEKDYTNNVNDTCTKIRNAILASYDAAYFEKNVLLMKPVVCGTSMYTIADVTYSGDTLNISAYNKYDANDECAPPANCYYLAMVTVPKTLYHAETVNWSFEEIETAVMPINGYPDKMNGYPDNWEKILTKQYIFDSYDQLVQFVNSISPDTDVVTPYTEALRNLLQTYDAAYFEEHTLLLKPFLNWQKFSITDVAYQGETLYITHNDNDYIVNDGIDTLFFGLVSMPTSMFRASEVVWSDNTILTAVDGVTGYDVSLPGTEGNVNDAVIQSESELAEYLNMLYSAGGAAEKRKFTEKYDSAFFEQYVLLLGSKKGYGLCEITSFYFVINSQKYELNINFTDELQEDPAAAYGTRSLMQVAVPRTIYVADTVKWNYREPEAQEKITWENKTLDSGCGEDFIASTKQEYVFYSAKELAAYIDELDSDSEAHDVMYDELRTELLETYNDTYFADNILLMKPVWWYSLYQVESAAYDGDTLQIDCTYWACTDDINLDYSASLTLISVPQSMWKENTSVSWNCRGVASQQPEEISWTVEELQRGRDFDATVGKEYLFTSKEGLARYFDSIYENSYTNSPDDPCEACKASYLERYDDAYFAKNVLLMKPIMQNYGGAITTKIDSVTVKNGIVTILYGDDPYAGAMDCVLTPTLAQVTVPRSQWEPDSSKVRWNYQSSRKLEYGVDTLEVYGSDFDATVGKEYRFTTKAELEEYFDMIYYQDYTDCINDPCTEIKNTYLEKYDDSFFAQNTLLMKPLDSISTALYVIEDVYTSSDSIWIDYCRNYSTADVEGVSAAQLAFVSVPRGLCVLDNVNWRNTETVFIDDQFPCGGVYEVPIVQNTYDFASPDGTYHFYVQQDSQELPVKMGPADSDAETMMPKAMLTFYRKDDHYEQLKYLTTETIYPFSDKGEWSKDENGYDVFSNASSISEPTLMESPFSVTWKENSVVFEFYINASETMQLEFDYPDLSVRTQTLTREIGNPEKPEIVSVDLTADCAGDLQYKADIKDVYAVDWMATGTVGLVGTPIQLTWKEDVTPAQAVIHYNESELRWVPEQNLKLLYYHDGSDGTMQMMENVQDAVLDMENNTMTFAVNPDAQGIYLLVDWYEWKHDKNYAYEKGDISAYLSDWERGYDTGSIMELADKAWAMGCNNDFHVSTPEELASAVWFVNAGGGRCDITLEADIDLSGYDWVPMGYSNCGSGNDYIGNINGNGYTIKNMRIKSDQYHVGFIGASSYASEIYDLTFENAEVSGGRCTAIVWASSNSQRAVFRNVHLTGTVTSSGSCDNPFSSNANPNLTECTADVFINGKEVILDSETEA